MNDYERIAAAIDYLAEHAGQQPALDELAAQARLSPAHFQRLFSRWAGTSPKRLLQVFTVERGKALLAEAQSVDAVAGELGLSGASRLYDHFVTLDAVTPGEFKRAGAGLRVGWGVADSPVGELFLAWTDRGLLRADFLPDDVSGSGLVAFQSSLQSDWPEARVKRSDREADRYSKTMFRRPAEAGEPLSLCVSGTNFQLAVWRALLRIPPGRVSTYSALAEAVGRPGATRAVGNAVGANPIAFAIPCHRVIRKSGALGGYRWGAQRKRVLQLWERARSYSDRTVFEP